MKKINSFFIKHFLLFVFLGGSQILFGQSAKITGWVKDKNGYPLHGASVFLKDQRSGTITDSNGHFELDAPTGVYLIIASFVGYAEQRKKIRVRGTGTIIENFVTKEIYKNCPAVTVFCRTNERKLSKPVYFGQTLTKEIIPTHSLIRNRGKLATKN